MAGAKSETGDVAPAISVAVHILRDGVQVPHQVHAHRECNTNGLSVMSWPFAKEVVIFHSRKPGMGGKVSVLSIR